MTELLSLLNNRKREAQHKQHKYQNIHKKINKDNVLTAQEQRPGSDDKRESPKLTHAEMTGLLLESGVPTITTALPPDDEERMVTALKMLSLGQSLMNSGIGDMSIRYISNPLSK